MVYQAANTPAVLPARPSCSTRCWWGFTGQVISAMLDVAGWAQPWDDRKVLELDDAMARVGEGAR